MNEAKKCLKLILELIVAPELCTEGLKYDTSGFKFISENVQLWDFGGYLNTLHIPSFICKMK